MSGIKEYFFITVAIASEMHINQKMIIEIFGVARSIKLALPAQKCPKGEREGLNFGRLQGLLANQAAEENVARAARSLSMKPGGKRMFPSVALRRKPCSARSERRGPGRIPENCYGLR